MSARDCGCRDAPDCGHTTVAEQRLAEAIWPADEPVDDLHGDDSQTVWCRTELSPLGTYMLVIAFDDDNVLHLSRDSLLSYVSALSEAMLRARYAEGIRRQLLDVLAERTGQPPTREATVAALATVHELRQEWPDLPRFPPYRLVPIVSFEGNTSVQVWRGKNVIVQFGARNVAEHIVHALTTFHSADLDASYRRMLIGTIGIDPARASQVVADLANYHREE